MSEHSALQHPLQALNQQQQGSEHQHQHQQRQQETHEYESSAPSPSPSDTDANDEDRKYICDHCAHVFTRKHNLKSHLLTHTLEKPFRCHICSSKFRRLHDLKRHEKLHTGEKPFECKSCGRRFARADALVRHANSLSGCALIDEDNEAKRYESQFKVREQLPSITRLTEPLRPGHISRENVQVQVHRPERLEVPVREKPQDGLMSYVKTLEMRVATLESRLSGAELKIAQLEGR